MEHFRQDRRPLIAVLCHGQVLNGRPSQFTTEAFLAPVAAAGGSTILIPAIPDVVDIGAITRACDALLMTGSLTNVCPSRYGCSREEPDSNPDRDEVALRLSDSMIRAGRPVLGICLGMQELAVLHGSTLRVLDDDDDLHMSRRDWTDVSIFEHRHTVDIVSDRMAVMAGSNAVSVVSAHRQAIDRISSDLVIEATASDGTIEAFRADDEGRVCGVQWHPERLANTLDHALFRNLIDLA